jgi:hypothetical protein
MAKAVRLWQGVLNTLGSMHATGDNSRELEELSSRLLSDIVSSSHQPKASWKRLLKNMEVRGSSKHHTSRYM